MGKDGCKKAHRGKRQAGRAMRGYEILLVDDDPDILTVIASAFDDKGYQVTTASSGEAAIESLSINGFDLVITDINMAETDGIAVLKKAKELNPETIVMILTGNRDVNVAMDALRHGADDYMFKPCKLAELWQRVANCLERLELKRRYARPESHLHPLYEQLLNIEAWRLNER
ncbi:MAG: response regulator [Deltaproteobacteria bacterium]|nr:response regulator [Deltaproteobacteria bacterium]